MTVTEAPPQPVKAAGRTRTNPLWPALAIPGIIWLLVFFLAPMYVVLAIVFGQVDPIFRTPVPVWNPLQWDPTQFNYVLSRIGPDDDRVNTIRWACWAIPLLVAAVILQLRRMRKPV